MPVPEDFKTLDLPSNSNFESLKRRYDQLNEFLDPDLVENASLRAIASDAQSTVEEAYSRLKILIGTPESDAEPDQDNEAETKAPEKKKKPTKNHMGTEVQEKPDKMDVKPKIVSQETVQQPQVVPAKLPPNGTLAEELRVRLANLTAGDLFTEPWWALNGATVNGLIVLILALIVTVSIVLSDYTY